MYIRPYTLFSTLHPVLLLIYALGAPILAMLSKAPVCLLISIISAFSIHLFYLGREATVNALKLTIPFFLMMTLFNMVTNSGGLTVLFRIGQRNFTLESLCYGAANGIMLSSVIVWFRCFTAILPNDKFLYLFGSRFQNTGLLLSMILKLFPETNYKIRCIKLADNGKGTTKKETMMQRIKKGLTQISCLLEWSMEDSIETADSMKARGYGDGKRTTYNRYHFAHRETGGLLTFLVLLLSAGVGVMLQDQSFWFFPTIKQGSISIGWSCIINVVYIIFLFLPIIMELRWKKG